MEIKTLKIFDNITISGTGYIESDVLMMEETPTSYSLQNDVSGDGTVKIQYLASLDGVSFMVPSAAADIISSQTKTSGDNSDGKDIVSFSPVLSKYIKLKATETGGSNSVTLTTYLAVK